MTERIPAAEYAALRGIPVSAVIHNIKAGIFDGVEENGEWFVIRRMHASVPTPAAKPERVPQAKRPRALQTKKVVHYTSHGYVNVLLILLGLLVGIDVVLFLLHGDPEYIRGIGIRAGPLVMLWTKHKWARLAVQVWAGFLVFAGVSGLYLIYSADLTEFTFAWWAPIFWSSSLTLGAGILFTAHRFIKVEEVPVDPPL